MYQHWSRYRIFFSRRRYLTGKCPSNLIFYPKVKFNSIYNKTSQKSIYCCAGVCGAGEEGQQTGGGQACQDWLQMRTNSWVRARKGMRINS